MVKMLSIIVPCYNEELTLNTLWEALEKETAALRLQDVSTEVIFVDDGSTDQTLACIKDLENTGMILRYLSFSRNFGKEAAIMAGLEASIGDYIVIMDADMQDPPALLRTMLDAILREGYDSVGTRRVSRKGEPPIRSFFARRFYKLINRISRTTLVDGARDYRMMTRQVADAILQMREYNRFSKGIMQWVGFKTKWIEYENIQRSAGETKWSFWKLFAYSMEGIVAFSTAPLAISAMLGIILCLVAFVSICVVIAKTLIFGDPVGGWPSLIVTVLFVGGVQLFCIGILGQYLSRTYLETKNRPLYIVKESSGQRDEG